ncbi:hypothetical protein SBA7_1660012 [Candidatus Sulfotelmatobacter sp. SbA7]|nr:hypothetical protein SBA7_1660012 [Candidatus Sulfotelmatobacter sp. SbA7]
MSVSGTINDEELLEGARYIFWLSVDQANAKPVLDITRNDRNIWNRRIGSREASAVTHKKEEDQEHRQS